ncbi:hypothetical protein L6R52_39205, partial [Myxococcota bacterium]|nr:hypothetical protein [Myxococcota bacterium]
FDQAGALDTRARRWREVSDAPREEAPVVQTSAPKSDAPIPATDRSESARRTIQGAPHLMIPEASIGRPRRARAAAQTSGLPSAQTSRTSGAAKPQSLGVQSTLLHRPMGAFSSQGAITIG